MLPQFGGAFTSSATAVFDYPTIGSLAAQVPESDDADSVGAAEAT